MKIVFFGTPDFAVPTLEGLLSSPHEVALVVAQPDRPAGRGLKLHVPPTVELARKRGVPVAQPSRIRDLPFLEHLESLRPDLGVVVAYGKILPPALLKIPAHGFVNVHASLLPAYRGAAPIQRALEAGERETGLTIMRVDEELDHGPILVRETLIIGPDERAPALAAKMASSGGPLLLRSLDAIESGSLAETPQDHSRASYAPKIEKLEGRIDWEESAGHIYDRFRAFTPWPGVYFELQGERIGVEEMRPELGLGTGSPGHLLEFASSSVVVSCGHGALRLMRLHRPGKKVSDAAEYARSRKLKPGDALR